LERRRAGRQADRYGWMAVWKDKWTNGRIDKEMDYIRIYHLLSFHFLENNKKIAFSPVLPCYCR